MAKYELITNSLGEQFIGWDDNGVIRFIPISEANSDYQRYMEHLTENPTEDVE